MIPQLACALTCTQSSCTEPCERSTSGQVWMIDYHWLVLAWQIVFFVTLCNADCLETCRKSLLIVLWLFVSVIDDDYPRAGECVDVYSVIVYWAIRKFHMRWDVGDELSVVPSWFDNVISLYNSATRITLKRAATFCYIFVFCLDYWY